MTRKNLRIGKCSHRPISETMTKLLRNNYGGASSTVAGFLLFGLGVGLTLFVLVNPMKISVLDQAKQKVLPQAEQAEPAAADTGGRKIKYWRAPMDPTYISDKPGKSPMGMDLIPVYEDEAASAADNAIRIDPATVQNIGVVSETVKRGDLRVEIRTVGTLDYNEDRIFWVNNKYDGWIEKVYVNYIGQHVRQGEPLFEIYSPELVSTQEEYLSALRYRDKLAGSGYPDAVKQAESLLQASRNRLRYWDITDKQIENLERTGKIKKTLTVVSPVAGIVTGKMDQALEGMYAKAGMNLYKVADLSSLWAHVDIYEYQLPWITVGQEAKLEISYYPGEVFTGKVRFFYPYLDEKTRTNKVCIEIPNPDNKLRPQMFATVTFAPVAAKDAVLVPEMAVLHSGERDVVVVDSGDGRFEPREVKLGLQGEQQYQVLEGLKAGEKIVVSSQFLIDSESNLREAINKMLMAKKGETAETGGAGHADAGHGDESHSLMKMSVDDPKETAALGQVIEAYLPIWRTLAADSKEGVLHNAKMLAEAVRNAAGITTDQALKNRLATLEKAAESMKADDLDQARESMKKVSRALVGIFEMYDTNVQGNYAIIECPMLKEKWMQDTEDVRNPYFGSAMLKCGNLVAKI